MFYTEISIILKFLPLDYELLFINDGSKDKTLDIIKELSLNDMHVKYLSFSRDFGLELLNKNVNEYTKWGDIWPAYGNSIIG